MMPFYQVSKVSELQPWIFDTFDTLILYVKKFIKRGLWLKTMTRFLPTPDFQVSKVSKQSDDLMAQKSPYSHQL